MSSARRIVPDWEYFIPQLTKAIKEGEEGGREDHEEDTVCLDAVPTIQFRYSCSPNYIQCLTAFSGHTGTTVVGFLWGHKMAQHQMKVWTENLKGELCHYESIPLENGYKVQHLIFVPCQRVFVGACSDFSLRVFSDPAQSMILQYRAMHLSSVLCMHYCKETEELLTGSMGNITFWGFWTSLEVPLGVTRVLDWNCCSLHRDTIVSALITERQTSTLYALCNRHVKIFDFRSKKELWAFWGRGKGTLHCVSSDWVRRYLYTGDVTGCVQVWSWDSRSLLQEFQAHSCSVSTVVLRPNTHTLLTSSADGWVKEWSCRGDLLLKLFLDEPGGVCDLWPIGEHQIICHSPSSFSVWQLQSIYRLFNDSKCVMRYLQRVECGLGRARLLAMSQDSIVHLISPVSGEMLLLSWPFLLLQQALDFAYNPSREELFVASGTREVLVLDMTRCPSPAKRILCASVKQDHDESVMSLEAVMMDESDWANSKPPPCLVFSGHRNGKLQLLSPRKLNFQAHKAHVGAVLKISSMPGQRPLLCCYGTDEKLSVWVVKVGVEQVELIFITQMNCYSSLMLTQLMSDFIFAVSPGNSLLLYSLLDGKCLTLNRKPPTAISCMDYCAALGLVAISGPAGIVELWDTRGIQLAEIRLGAPVSQVCFANARGDLLACFSGSIFIISGVQYLPVRLLRQVLDQAPCDDLLEDPISFLSHSFSYYDLGLVPRMLLKPGEATPEPEISPTASTAKNIQLPHLDIHIEASDRPKRRNAAPKRKQQGPRFYTSTVVKAELEKEMPSTTNEPEAGSIDWNQLKTPVQPVDVEPKALRWPIAPDGFIPNSVIRNWGREPQETEAKAPVAKVFRGTYTDSADEHVCERVNIVTKARAQSFSKFINVPASQKLLKQLDEHLTDDLQLQQSEPEVCPKSTGRVTRPHSQQDSTVDNLSNVDSSPQNDDMPDQGKEHLKPPQPTRTQYRKFSISLFKTEAVESEPEPEGLIDPLTMDLYKKIKTQDLTNCPSLQLNTGSLVQLPPTTPHHPELLRLEPTKGQGDPNWRQSLHQLISIYGFRSQKASWMAAQRQLHPPKPRQDNLSCTLSPVYCSQLYLGQRVVERIGLREMQFPSQFHHIMPLPWQLNIHTRDHVGESQYGRLNVNWRAGPMYRPTTKLPPIPSKMAPCLVSPGGSVS